MDLSVQVIPASIPLEKPAGFVKETTVPTAVPMRLELDLPLIVVVGPCLAVQYFQCRPNETLLQIEPRRAGVGMPGLKQVASVACSEGRITGAHQCYRIGWQGLAGVVTAAAASIACAAAARTRTIHGVSVGYSDA